MTTGRPALAAAVAVVVLVAGCGGSAGGDGKSVAAWTANACTAIVNWNLRIEEDGAGFERAAPAAGSAEALRREWAGFLDDVVRDTDRLIAEFEAAGTPPVEDGPAIRRDFHAGLDRLREFFVHERERAAKLPVDDLQTFAAALEEQGESIQGSTADLEKAFVDVGKKYESDEIDQAWEEEEACSELR